MVEIGKCCCFTGHRPGKCTRTEQEIRNELTTAINNAINAGITAFISGGAKGVDTWAAEIILELRKENAQLRLILALPNEEWLHRCSQICAAADMIEITGTGHHPGIYQNRNKWMVDHSARVIAVFNGQPGGTKNTIEYAKQCGVPVFCIQG